MSFTEEYGDLFDSSLEHLPLAHCVAADFGMGAGIAVVFVKNFGNKELLRSSGVRPGGFAKLEVRGRLVYYLVTKERSWDKPTYESLESSVSKMFQDLRDSNQTQLAIPKIGCGLDGLKWEKVRDILKKHQGNVNVTVRYL